MNPPVSSPAIKVVKSVREQVSAEEWQARVDLAACYRLTAMYGMTEMIANHISCRVPGHQHQWATKYRRRMKDLRRRGFCCAAKPSKLPSSGARPPQRVGDG